MIKRLLMLGVLFSASLFILSASASAVDVLDICDTTSSDANQSAVCRDKDIRIDKSDADSEQANPIFGPNGILTIVVNVVTSIVAIIAVITIILAGLKLITSGSNPQDVTKSREQILYALIALGVAGLAQAAVRFIINRI